MVLQERIAKVIMAKNSSMYSDDVRLSKIEQRLAFCLCRCANDVEKEFIEMLERKYNFHLPGEKEMTG